MEQLKDAVSRYLMLNGEQGYAALMDRFGKSKKTIDRWAKVGVHNSYLACQLALACGLEEEDALAIAKECSSERPRRTA